MVNATINDDVSHKEASKYFPEYPLTTSISMAGWLKVEVHKSSMHLPVACVPLLAEVGSIKLRVNKEVISLCLIFVLFV